MKQFEDQFKDAFEHFEPEVDPKLWQHISRELPSTQVNPGPTTSGNSLLTQLGIKGVLALVTAASITLLSIWYFNHQKAEPNSVKTPVAADQKIASNSLAESDAPSNGSTSFQPSGAEKREESASNNSSEQQLEITSSANNTHPSDHLQEKALTGNGYAGKGESISSNDSPSSHNVNTGSVKTENQTEKSNTSVSPDLVSDNKPLEKPVLILSTKGGFAPLSITALHNQNAVQAIFDFGDGKVIEGNSASHTFTEPGIYTIRCEIKGTTLEQQIEVIGQIPSAFSPNGDGVNDFFTISDLEDISIEIRIYNRAGKLMFNSKGRSVSWDGHSPDGQNADAGTYLYDIFATSEGGSSYKQKGTIHLFR